MLLCLCLYGILIKNKIEYIGEYPERETPKEPVHKDKINLNESKLSLIDTVKDINI